MAHQSARAYNRVTPFGKIEAFPLRGASTGNRGIEHSGREIACSHAHESRVIRALGRSLVR